jgi:hypothetical protein
MDTNRSCTADVFSDICGRLAEAIQRTDNTPEEKSGREQVLEVQKKIDELRGEGLLKRQEYAAAKTADFQRIFARKI